MFSNQEIFVVLAQRMFIYLCLCVVFKAQK